MYSVYESDPSLLSPICKLIALLIQSNSNSTQEFEITKAPHIDDFEPKVIAALYETLYGYVANILQVKYRISINYWRGLRLFCRIYIRLLIF